MKKITTIPVHFTSYKPRADRSISLTFVTMREFSPEDVAGLHSMLNTEGHLGFKHEPYTDKELYGLPEMKVERTDRTPSQRLRAVLFRLWEQNDEGLDKDQHYKEYMERIINHFKTKLEE